MNRLVQDDKYSVVYGTFRGESNQDSGVLENWMMLI